MPLSMNANFSCDVNKDGGVDLYNGGGPFNTIGAAINFLVDNFGALMSADRHGVVHIGPGVYPETILLTASHIYIDLVGDGRDVTIIQFADNNGFNISDYNAVNRVSGLTIHCTGTAQGTYAVNVSDNNGVRIEDCLIMGGAECISFLGLNTRMLHCDVISGSAIAGDMINGQIRGEIDSCFLQAASALGGSVLINSLEGVVRNSRLSTLQSGGPEVRTVNFLSGKLSYCTLEAQGNAIYEANGTSIVEFCYLSTQGTQGSAVVTRLNGCTMRNCFLHQKIDAPVVAYGPLNDAVVNVVDTTFFAPLCTGNIIENLSGNGSRWEGCRMIGADSATSGYALAADALDRIVVVKDIVSNRPIDPLIRLTDNGLVAKSIGEAKGYSQKRWWALQSMGPTTQGVGVKVNEYSPGGIGSGCDTTGSFRRMQLSGTDTCGIFNDEYMRRTFKPKLRVKFRIEGIETPDPYVRFWCGFFQVAPPTGSDDLSSNGCIGVGLLLSPNYDFVGVASTGVGGTTYTSSLKMSGSRSDPHVFTMYYDALHSQFIFQLDGQQYANITDPYLPSDTDNVTTIMQVTSTYPNTKCFDFYNAWCEFDP